MLKKGGNLAIWEEVITFLVSHITKYGVKFLPSIKQATNRVTILAQVTFLLIR
jgi:hypothetical protein